MGRRHQEGSIMLTILIVWCVLSVPVSLVLGAMARVGGE
jgi:hypothetical protein